MTIEPVSCIVMVVVSRNVVWTMNRGSKVERAVEECPVVADAMSCGRVSCCSGCSVGSDTGRCCVVVVEGRRKFLLWGEMVGLYSTDDMNNNAPDRYAQRGGPSGTRGGLVANVECTCPSASRFPPIL